MSQLTPDRLVDELVVELRRAWAYTDELCTDLTDDELHWRPNENSSAIGWHLGHQAAVAHFLVRNLLAAEVSPDTALDTLMDSANPEPDRGDLPNADRLGTYRADVAERVLVRIDDIQRGSVGAPDQLLVIASGLVRALVNHEYQHDQWIAEVRSHDLGKPCPKRPESSLLIVIDGYVVLR